MNNSFSLKQILKTGNLDLILISRRYKLNLLADLMWIKNEIPKLKQSEIANQLGYPLSTLQRYRNNINMLSPYRIQTNNKNKQTKKASNNNFNKKSHREPEVKRPQMSSNDLKTTQTNTKLNKKNKIILKAGSVHENFEINDQSSDEILDNNNKFTLICVVIVLYSESYISTMVILRKVVFVQIK